MIKGIGVDIMDHRRIKNLDEFANRVLSDDEKKRYSLITNEKTKRCYLGARFAAKEALFKATNKLVDFKSISVLNDESGAPYVVGPYDDQIFISLSHEEDYSIAYVICEKKDIN